LENEVARLRLCETGERNHEQATGETDNLLTPANKLVRTGHAAFFESEDIHIEWQQANLIFEA
jgi:hypothetical protein